MKISQDLIESLHSRLGQHIGHKKYSAEDETMFIRAITIEVRPGSNSPLDRI